MDKGGVAYSWGYGGSGWEGAGALGLGDLSDVEYIVKSPTEISIMSDVGAKVRIGQKGSEKERSGKGGVTTFFSFHSLVKILCCMSSIPPPPAVPCRAAPPLR